MLLNKNGFTLIELLVVVAIIGILAAVGVVAYNGYTSSAKANATKQMHAQTIKYAQAEVMKCKMGDSTAMEGYLNCSAKSPHWFALQVASALTNVPSLRENNIDYGVLKDFKNPYNNSLPALRSRFEYVAGQISISVVDDKLQILTCFKVGCASDDRIKVYVSTAD